METDYKCSLSQTSALLTLMPHNHWIFCKQDAQIPGLKDKIFKYHRKFSGQQNFIGSKTTKKNEDSWERKTNQTKHFLNLLCHEYENLTYEIHILKRLSVTFTSEVIYILSSKSDPQPPSKLNFR